jgi:uncharacterized protein YegL
MNDFIQDSELAFHTDLLDDGNHFGILKLTMKKVPITQKTIFLYVSVDNSGSMDESHRGKTKLSFVKKTLNNMIEFLGKQEANIYIQIQTFNNKVQLLVDYTKITTENTKEIVEKINKLEADCDTDIGNAISVANDIISTYKTEHPDHEIAHIFMSDGSPTSGLTNTNQLLELVKEEFNNIFIGFGLDHNAHLFHKFSEKNNTEYRFIDKIENTSLVYGEIIHQLLYPALNNIKFVVNGGEMYDWKTNTWLTTVTESVIVSEANKIYHIRTLFSASDTYIDIMQGDDIIETVSTIPSLISLENGSITTSCIEDLAKYLFRQRTMECLFESKNKLNSQAKKNLKEKMRTLFKEMHKYMRENNILDDPMMTLLCDDIYITYKTMNFAYSMMFAVARCSSQGRQQAYNTTLTQEQDYIDEEDFDSDCETTVLHFANRRQVYRPKNLVGLGRQGSISTEENDSDEVSDMNVVNELDEDDLDNYVSTNNNTTCYSTPMALDTMRQMSQK